MATEAGYAKYVCDQLADAGGITASKMFGEYGLYRHGKIVGLIADNQCFVKPTPEGVAVVGTPIWGPPYPGAKLFINASELLDDPETFVRLILVTDAALPAPKPKAKAKQPVKKAVKKAVSTPVKKATKKAASKAATKAAKRKSKGR